MKWNIKILPGIVLLAALALAGCANPQGPQNSGADASGAGSNAASHAGATGAVFSLGDLTMTLPDGWTVPDDSGSSIIYGPDYPDDTSNIGVQKADKNPTLSMFTKDLFKKIYDQMLTQALGADVNTTIDSFDKLKVSDCDALQIKLHYTLKGVEFAQLLLMIDADASYTVTFTQTGGADWMDAFAASAKTVLLAS